MPKEETIELRHIRSVLGEKEDLPSFNPRASLTSRIRALISNSEQTPESINKYGTAGLSKSLSIGFIPNTINSNGKYLFVGSLSAPAKITIIDLNTYAVLSTLDISGYILGGISASEIDSNYLYVVGQGPATVVKINLDSFIVESSLLLSIGTDAPNDIKTDGTKLFISAMSIGLSTLVYKVNIATFTQETRTNMGFLGEVDLVLDGIFLYAINSDTVNINIVKFNISTFTSIATLVLSQSTITQAKHVPYIHGNFLYIHNGDTLLSEVNLLTFTVSRIMNTVTLYSSGSITISDGSMLIITGNVLTASSVITYVDIATLTEYGTATIPANNKINTLIIDNTFLYLGLVGNLILRTYIYPTTKTDSRYISKISSNISTLLTNITSIITLLTSTNTTGTYSHVNNINEQTVLEFAAATQDIELRTDMSNITQNTTVREYEQIDGANYQQLSSKIFPTDFDSSTKAVAFSFTQSNRKYNVTFQSSVAEGSNKNVPYTYRTIPKV